MIAFVRVSPRVLGIVLATVLLSPIDVSADHPAGTPHISKGLSSPATNTTGSYTVTWNGDGATQLILQEKQNGGPYLTSYVGTGSSKSYTKSSGTFTYRIRQDICFWGECEYLYTAPVTTVVTLPPTGPTISGPSSDTDGSFTVSWNSVSGATRYEAEQR